MNTSSMTSTTFDQRQHWRTLIVGGVAAVFMVGAAYGILTVVERSQHEQIAKELQSILGIAHTSCHKYLDRQRGLTRAFAERPMFAPGLRAALGGQPDANLKARIDSLLPTIDMAGWALIDPEGRVRQAGGSCAEWTEAPLNLRAKLKDVLSGQDVILPPRLLPAEGGDEKALIVAACRVLDGDKTIGLLAMTVDPAGTITEMLAHSRYGETGESYIVDMEGILCSRSRYYEDLRTAGLIPADAKTGIGLFRVARPPTPLSKGRPNGNPASWPLTTAAAGIMARTPGYELEKAYDYRGERVVCAWDVCPEHLVGLVTTIDDDEAFATLEFLQKIFGGLVVLLAVAVALGIFWVIRAQRLYYQYAKAQRQVEQLGQYQMIRKLGQGGMGTVYLASHALMRRQTAVKLITGTVTQETAARFEREVRLSCQLTHPNSIAVYDFGRTADGTFYYAMEYLEGMDLEAMVHFGGPLPPARVIHFLQQACGSLAEAHRMKMIHRDIKPGNLFVTRRGDIPDFLKVLDFGLAKSTDQHATKLSMENVVSGTPGYMAPEMLQGMETDGRSDLYSLACVAYFLLTGHMVFERDSVMDIVMAHLQQEPLSPSKIAGKGFPGDLEMTIMRCLDKNPDERPKDAAAFREELRMCEDAGKWTDAEAWWAKEAPAILERKCQREKGQGQDSSKGGNDLLTLVVNRRG